MIRARRANMKRRNIVLLVIVGIFMFFIVALAGIRAFIYFWKDIRDVTTDIGKYEEYLGEDGDYKENFGRYNDIFPNAIPASAEIEEFCYYYYNLWDPCYLGYLVYTCGEEEYQKEYERLKNIDSSKLESKKFSIKE